jgi:hypothetical protein
VPYELSFTKVFEIAPERAGWGPGQFYINDCCWGGDVICQRLLPLIEPHYEKVRSLQEDWGWFIWFRKGDQRFEINVMCDCPEYGEFRIHLVAFTRDWLLRRVTRDTPELEQMRAVVTNELRSWAGKVETTPMDSNFMQREELATEE